MSNTEVKLQHADSSWGIAPCKDRTLPRYLYGGLAQLGERLPYKQRVTGSSPVSSIEPLAQLVEHLTFNQRVDSSRLSRLIMLTMKVRSDIIIHVVADLAQLVEHLSCKQGVGSSNLLVGI
jgi:hypothetical protein